MAEKSLNQLRKERDNLRKKFKDIEQKQNTKRLTNIEKREIQKEIRALKHPRSIIAAKSFFKSAKKSSTSAFAFIKKRAKILDENLQRQEREERMRKRSNRKQKTDKKTKKK